MGSNTSITHTSPTLMFERRHHHHQYAHSKPVSRNTGRSGNYRKDRVSHSLNVSSNGTKFNDQFDSLVEQDQQQQYVHRSNDDLIFSNRQKSVNGRSHTPIPQEKPSPAVNTVMSPKSNSTRSSISSIHKTSSSDESYTPILPFVLPKVESDNNFIILHAPSSGSPPKSQLSISIESKTDSDTSLSSPQKSVSPSKLPKINFESFSPKKSDSNSSLNSLKENQPSNKVGKSRGSGSEDDLVNIDKKISSKINRFSLQKQLMNTNVVSPVNSSVTLDLEVMNLFSANRKEVQNCNCNSQTLPNTLPPLNENLGNDEISITVTAPPCLPDLSHLNVSHCKLRMLSNEMSNKRKMSRMNKRESMFNFSSTSKPIVLR